MRSEASTATKNEKRKTKNAKCPVGLCTFILRFSILVSSFSFQFAYAEDSISPQTQASIDRALKYLNDHQDKEGTWKADIGPSTAVTSLGTMAFLARGHVPGQGPYGDTINKSIDYVVAHQMPNGLLSANSGTMYDHGISTVMLCEAYGMIDDGR